MYKLGRHSLRELNGVNPILVDVVKIAIEITEQDFTVHDGLRTLQEQKILVARGASTTLKSKHLTGHAVDLVPYINGKLRWEWGPIYMIADAMRDAALDLGVSIRWGGAWDIDFTNSDLPPRKIVENYVVQRKNIGKRAFIDGPHYEMFNVL